MGWAWLILRSLDGELYKHVLWFNFIVTNNEIEYEALLIQLKLSKGIGIKSSKIFNNSQLIVNQVNNMYEAHDPFMASYLVEAKWIIVDIPAFNLEQISRSEYMVINALSRSSPKGHSSALQGIIAKTLDQWSINKNQISITLVEATCMSGIWNYLKTGALPNNPTMARKIQR